jgi:hypothetical protein
VAGVVFSITFGLATFLLFKVVPILLVGRIVVKVLERMKNRGSLSGSDRWWLDGE